MKKLNWLDNFAQEQAKKEAQKITKKASSVKKSKEIIVNKTDVPNARDGKVVRYQGKKYRVVQANYNDDKGPGVVLSEFDGVAKETMTMAVGADPNTLQPQGVKSQEYARTKLPIEENYTHDNEAADAQASAAATQQKLTTDNAKDITTPKGRFGVNEAPILPGEVVVDLDDQNVGENLDGDFEIEDLDNQPSEDVLENNELPTKQLGQSPEINEEVIDFTKKLASAITAEVEESLAYAESVVKRTVPARFARTTLASLEGALDKEGIEVSFDKTITKQQIQKTASEKASKTELVEVRNFVNTAFVADLEEVLEEADEIMGEQAKKIAKKTKSLGLRKLAEIEHKMKSMMERRLKSIGIYARFERKFAVPARKR